MPILRPCVCANSTRSGSRAIVPSSFMISQITAAGVRPARRARSQPASVWPARTSTPPACAITGKMWPGCTMSEGFASGAIAARTVRARSAAEMPVVTPSAASIDTVKVRAHATSGSRDHRRQLERSAALLGQREADQAARMPRHEIDRLGRDELGGEHEVAFVLAILLVDQHDHSPGLEVGDDVGDGRKRHGRWVKRKKLHFTCARHAPIPSPDTSPEQSVTVSADAAVSRTRARHGPSGDACAGPVMARRAGRTR